MTEDTMIAVEAAAEYLDGAAAAHQEEQDVRAMLDNDPEYADWSDGLNVQGKFQDKPEGYPFFDAGQSNG